MVTKIVAGKSIKGALYYNENKVEAGEATLLMASGFAADVQDLSFDQKLQRFEHLTSLNPKTKTNTLHITLNFDQSDQLSALRYGQVASAFMERIGFGDQPFLVYQHTDAAHPHLHVVTTNIQLDGQRIDTHNIGRTLALAARRELEAEFGLVKAEGRQYSEALGIKAVEPAKLEYGMAPTKRAISNVVMAVMRTYKYGSLAEFNAALKQFNVVADRGTEGSVMYQKGGLLYYMLDKDGEKVGVPIKASAIYGKPTLANLEKRFAQGKESKKAFKDKVRGRIEKVFAGYEQITKATLLEELQARGLHTTFHESKDGQAYGVTFVDNQNKAVFKGSELGKDYTAKALTARLNPQDKKVKPEKKTYLKQGNSASKSPSAKTYIKAPAASDYLKLALKGKDGGAVAPSITKPKRKKKKNKGVHL